MDVTDVKVQVAEEKSSDTTIAKNDGEVIGKDSW